VDRDSIEKKAPEVQSDNPSFGASTKDTQRAWDRVAPHQVEPERHSSYCRSNWSAHEQHGYRATAFRRQLNMLAAVDEY
jgi:hypothetical protein